MPRGDNPNSRKNLRPIGKRGPGRAPNAGKSIKEWYNALAALRLSDKELYRIAKGQRQIRSKRIAAGQLFRASQMPDLADFEAVYDEGKDLSQLRAKGIDTTVVKKVKSRIIQQGNDSAGKPLPPIIERELELKDDTRQTTEHIIEQTDGKAAQTMQGPGGTPLVAGVLILPPDMPPEPELPSR